MLLDPEGFFDRVRRAMGTNSVPEIAKKLNISKHAVYFWEKGQMPGLKGLKNVIRIAEVSNTSLEWLLTGNGPSATSTPYAVLDVVAALIRSAEKLAEEKDTQAVMTVAGSTVEEIQKSAGPFSVEEDGLIKAVKTIVRTSKRDPEKVTHYSAIKVIEFLKELLNSRLTRLGKQNFQDAV